MYIMKLSISERTHPSKIKPQWDNHYWIIYIYEGRKQIFYKHYNKMFDFDTYFEDLIKSHSITEIHCVHSTPPCVAKFRINSAFPNRE